MYCLSLTLSHGGICRRAYSTPTDRCTQWIYHAIIIRQSTRPADIDMSEDLNKRCCNFFYQTPVLLHRAAATHQMYNTGSVVVYTRSSHSSFSLSSPNFYRRPNSAKFCIDFQPHSTTLDFEPPSFQNGISYLKTKVNLLRFDFCSM